MSDGTVNINLEGNVFDLLKQLDTRLGNLETTADKVEKTTTSAFGKIAGALSIMKLNAYSDALSNVSQSLDAINAPGMKFESQMQDLSAITGLTGSALDNIGDKARKNAKEFGGSAAQSVETYKLLLSQLTPELAKQPKILDDMARNSALLSKTMGGDQTAATEVLTTAMNQYGVSMDDPIKASKEMSAQMNIMSAASKEGSAELPAIKSAIENSGMEAKASGLSFAELNTQIQLLDKSGKKGAEGGTALRSILTTLSKGRFLPKETREELMAAGVNVDALADKNVKFSDKMRMLQPVLQKDKALISALFGEYGSSAAALIQNADAGDKFTASITGTNTTLDQAKAVMESTAEKQKRMQAAIDDAKISFFEATGGASAYLSPLAEIGQTIMGLTPLYNAASGAVKALSNSKLGAAVASKVATAATWLWNIALNANPIFLITAGIIVAAGAVYALTKAVSAGTAASRVDNEVKSRVIEKTADQRAELEILFQTLKTAKKGSEEYNNTLKDLERMQPGIVEKYNLQAGSLKDINAAQREMIANIDAIAQAEAYKLISVEKYKESFKKKQEGPGATDFIWGAITNSNAYASNEANAETDKKDAQYALRQQVKIQNSKQYKNAIKSIPGSGGASDAIITPKNETGESSTPGVVKSGGRSSGSTSFSSDQKEAKKIDVRISNLVNNLTVQVSQMKDAPANIQQLISEALINAVRDFEVAM